MDALHGDIRGFVRAGRKHGVLPIVTTPRAATGDAALAVWGGDSRGRKGQDLGRNFSLSAAARIAGLY